MIVTFQTGVLYEVRLAYLTAQVGEKDRYFSTSEQLIAYLKERADVRFNIFPHRLGEELSRDPHPQEAYGPHSAMYFVAKRCFTTPAKVES